MVSDTSPQMQAKMEELLLKKTPTERLEMGFSMFDFSRKLVTYSLLEKNPNLSSQELKVELFKIFYGEDFDKNQQQKIIKHFLNLPN